LTAAASDVIQALKDKRDPYQAIKWEDLSDTILQDLQEAWKIGGYDGVAQLDLKGDMLEVVETLAASYALARSAELVSKKRIGSELVDDPSARYSIAETTKDDLQFLLEKSAVKTPDQIATELLTSRIFSRRRAELIATTELAMAQFAGNLALWKSTDTIKSVNLVLSPDHSVEDECDEIYAQGPFSLENCPSLPLHVNCRCGLTVTEINS
jgi:hypothetical protein